MDDFPLTKQGVRDLNKTFPIKYKSKPVKLRKAEKTESGIIMDLIYADDKEIRAAILSQYPNAKLEGEYDFVHEDRLSVTIVSDRLDWYRFLLREGLAAISLVFGMAIYQDQDDIEMAMDFELPGWRDKVYAKGEEQTR